MTEYEKKCLTCKNNYKPSDYESRCNCMCFVMIVGQTNW